MFEFSVPCADAKLDKEDIVSVSGPTDKLFAILADPATTLPLIVAELNCGSVGTDGHDVLQSFPIHIWFPLITLAII